MEATHNPRVMTGLAATRDSDGSVTLIADGPDGTTVMRLSPEMAAALADWERSGGRLLAYRCHAFVDPRVHTTWPHGASMPPPFEDTTPCNCP